MHKLIYIFVFSMITAGAQTKMSLSEANDLKALVKKQAEMTETITSDFVQYQHIDFLSNDIESSGRMAFKSPNMVRWEYLQPDPYSIVFKNGKLYTDQNGKKSSMDMGSNKVFTQLNQLITSSIKGDMFDTDEFTITYYHKSADNEVHFMPKDEQFAEFINSIHITFNNQGEVAAVKMLEPSGDFTRIVFRNRKVNVPLAKDVFDQ